MSSGYISEDGKTVSFEVNLGGKVGTLTLVHVDRNPEVEKSQDRIMLKFTTQDVSDVPDAQITTTNTVIINKNYTKILSHFLRKAADTIENWYDSK